MAGRLASPPAWLYSSAVTDQSETTPENEPTAEAEATPSAASSEPAPESTGDPLEEARSEAAKYRDQLLRTAADYDNFRKRSRRDTQDAERRAREDLLRELLPVFDNLERATQHAEGTSDVKSLADGISMVMRQFEDTLQKVGVERIKSVGQGFDPAVHEAIQHLETSEFEPGTVAAEYQAGYRVGERVVRPALVVVAKAPAN
jgi:molecular chaperone GrpE